MAPSRLRALSRAWLFALLALYAGVAAWQLGLPGLHYDEAREAGQNAMELLTGAPVMAFRGAALSLFGVDLPLMVQDYIGALNVYLALPLLSFTGIGVPNLRALAILIGLATLLLLERTVSEWLYATATGVRRPHSESMRHAPLHGGALIAVTLTAAAPSFVFWSRQGVFVTNLTQPLVLWCIWQGLRWRRSGASGALLASALAAGLALYAKLLAIWVIAPFALLMAVAWLRARRRGEDAPSVQARTLFGAALIFLLPLAPLFLFNVQTGGTFAAIGGNLGRSYYGVDNRDLLHNLGVRLPQLWEVLRGGHFWYLGGIYRNDLAPWLAAALAVGGLAVAWRRLLPPLLLIGLAVGFSLMTVSDLFITHYALLHPLLLGCAGIAAGALLEQAQGTPLRRASRLVAGAVVLFWLALDLNASLQYHRALARSGGLADHSDASYDFAYTLRYTGVGAPVALDWGMDATLRYLSEGAVTPIEIFGYSSPQAPDPGFRERLAPFLDRPDAAFLLRAPDQEHFQGRRAVFDEMAAARGKQPVLEATFGQRDGTPLFELWRLHDAP